MESLNDAQRLAVEAGDGPIAIIAGPGTGKTKTLIARIEYLLAQGVRPSAILALTFTKKAAEEMLQRLHAAEALTIAKPGVADIPLSQLSDRVPILESRGSGMSDRTRGFDEPYISTFHGLCFDLLHQKLGETPEIIDEAARLSIIKKLAKPAELKGFSTRELSLAISRAKNMADDPATISGLVAAYNAALAERNVCDFDDILVRVRDMLRGDSGWRAVVQKRFTHILVDEFQDTNALQYELLQLMRGTDSLFVIGDPKQSIYGFRGASGGIFDQFIGDFPQATIITLTTNYRSTQAVVAVANALYPDAISLTAHSNQPGLVQTVEVLNEYSEANWVLGAIQKAIGGSDLLRAVSDDQPTQHISFKDIAVLYRSRMVARTVQKVLTDSGIPTQIVGDGSPYDDPHVRIILELLAKKVGPERSIAIKNVNAQQIASMLDMLDSAKRPHDAAAELAAKLGFTVDAPLRQLLGTLVGFVSLADAVAYFDDIAARDFYDPRAEAVTLMTIHASKGLEFKYVFVIGVEEGVLPSTRGDEAEEKRLLYVAATRAKEQCVLLFTRSRGGETATLSHFVTAVPATLLPHIVDPELAQDQRRAQKRHAKKSQTSLF